MKNWRLAYRIALIDTIIVFFIGTIFAIISGADGAGIAVGVICLIGGLLNLFAAFIAGISSSPEFAKGFLLSCGILLLLSGISCGTGLADVNFH